MRALLWVLGIVFVLVLGTAIFLPMLVDEEALIRVASEKIEEQSGVKITVAGDASLSLFPKVALSTSDVTVVIPESGARVEANFLEAGVALMPLLRRSVEMDSITVDGLTLTQVAEDASAARTAELDTSTMSNAELDAFYAARKKAQEDAAANAAAEALAAPLALEIGELSLRDIRVRTVDDSGELISELQLKFLTASDLNTAGRPIPLTALILLPGSDGSENVEITVEGSATANAQTATLDDFAVLIEGATAEPLQLLANGEAALDTGVATVELTIASGTLEGSGSVRYAPHESPMIDADLALTELNPALLLLAGPEAGAAATQETDSSGDEALPLHALRMIDTRATLAIDTVVLDAHRLENVKAQLRVIDGVATLKPVTATLHGGDISFDAVLDAHYNTAKVTSEGGLTSLDVGSAMAALDTGLGASGTADLTWSLTGAGRSSAEIKRALNGPINFTTADITLQGVGMQGMFCRAVALVNQQGLVAEFSEDTQFQALSATVQLLDGVATLDPLTAQMNTIDLSGTGAVNLETQELRASLRGQIVQGLGDVDPACRVNERYAELRWPVECRGNLAGDPANWCAVDTGEIVRDLAENEAKRKVGEQAGKLLKKLFE